MKIQWTEILLNFVGCFLAIIIVMLVFFKYLVYDSDSNMTAAAKRRIRLGL